MQDWKDALKSIRTEMRASDKPLAAAVKPKVKRALSSSDAGIAKPQEIDGVLLKWATSPLTTSSANRSLVQPVHTVQVTRTKAKAVVVVPSIKPQARDPLARQPKSAEDLLPPIPSSLEHRGRHAVSKGRFLSPEPWIYQNAALMIQKSGSTSGQVTDVVIGVDFGTSFTKVSVGLKDIIVPVEWSGVSSHPEKFLLPTGFTELENGNAVLGIDPSADPVRWHQYLKQPFLQKGASLSSRAKAAVFLALVLQYVFAWLFRTHHRLLADQQVRWMFNLGAPSDGLEVGEIQETYRLLALAAWEMSFAKQVIRIDVAEALFRQGLTSRLPEGLMSQPAVIPEFVAQLAGYVQSPQRKPGLHALVDVGGGTLDVVTFNVHRSNEEDVFPFFVPKVLTLGTQMVNHNRLVGHNLSVDASRLPDDLSHLLTSEEFAVSTGLPLGHVIARDELLFREVRKTAKAVLHQTKARRYRRAPEWQEGLRIFITGGGAQVIGYQDAIDKGSKEVAQRVSPMLLPQHPRVSGFKGTLSEYQRVSVACGLALDEFSLGQIRPASTVEDDTPLVKPGTEIERPDRDELYAR